MSESYKSGIVGAIEITSGGQNSTSAPVPAPPSEPQIEMVVEKVESTPQETLTITPEKDVVDKSQLVQTDYIGKRITAYRQNSIDIEDTFEIVMEYVLAMAAKNEETIQKYEVILADIFQKRQSIKEQFPKL